ncbi:signal peptidase complex subunit 1-like isoform X2 [Nymphaea colorata]|nr:signal peptidase complex subunit 1-like isoform X2 [Nymphaea colorata]XP_031481572.1 signal peptidase complex subunit 1-like isoform X2 [Nymphaea colorata]
MDWQGQKLSENLMQAMLAIFAFIAFVTGYMMSSFQNMLIIYAAGVLLTMLITVPNWPFFNRHQLNWLDPSLAELNPKPDIQTSNTKKRTAKGYQK